MWHWHGWCAALLRFGRSRCTGLAGGAASTAVAPLQPRCRPRTAMAVRRHGPLAVVAALLGWRGAKDKVRTVMNAVAAAAAEAPAAAAPAGALRFLWPPTRQNRGYIGALMAATLAIIALAMRSPDTHVKQQMMDKKRRKAEEALDKLLEDAANAKPPSPAAEQAANAIADMAESVRSFPAQYQVRSALRCAACSAQCLASHHPHCSPRLTTVLLATLTSTGSV